MQSTTNTVIIAVYKRDASSDASLLSSLCKIHFACRLSRYSKRLRTMTASGIVSGLQ